MKKEQWSDYDSYVALSDKSNTKLNRKPKLKTKPIMKPKNTNAKNKITHDKTLKNHAQYKQNH